MLEGTAYPGETSSLTKELSLGDGTGGSLNVGGNSGNSDSRNLNSGNSGDTGNFGNVDSGHSGDPGELPGASEKLGPLIPGASFDLAVMEYRHRNEPVPVTTPLEGVSSVTGEPLAQNQLLQKVQKEHPEAEGTRKERDLEETEVQTSAVDTGTYKPVAAREMQASAVKGQESTKPETETATASSRSLGVAQSLEVDRGTERLVVRREMRAAVVDESGNSGTVNVQGQSNTQTATATNMGVIGQSNTQGQTFNQNTDPAPAPGPCYIAPRYQLFYFLMRNRDRHLLCALSFLTWKDVARITPLNQARNPTRIPPLDPRIP